MRNGSSLAVATALVCVVSLLGGVQGAWAARDRDRTPEKDPYVDYVWPPPPDAPRIKLDAVVAERKDVEGKSKLKKILIGSSPETPWDRLRKPFAVEIDAKGRVIVSDSGSGGLIRVDLADRRWDVLGTQGAVRLAQPMGLAIGPDGTIWVADVRLQRVVGIVDDGSVRSVIGKKGELLNPTDVAVSPDGKRLFVADSQAQKIVVFEIASGDRVSTIGRSGSGAGEFAFPTSLVFGPTGDLFVVDQLNSRVQVVSAAGEPIDQFGKLGTGFGDFVRPKDVAIDEDGLVYVTDNAFNNVQVFDVDFTLLTFVGQGGEGPGQFHGISGLAVRGDRMAVVDQLGHRLQLFHFIPQRSGE